jgi:chromosome segregation ATPase
LFTESELRDVESRLKSCETDSESRIHSLEKETSELNALVSKLNEQVAEMDQQLADSELSMSRKVSFLDEDNVKLQEESTALRTQLISVKNSNFVFSEGLEEAIFKGEKYKTQIVQLETQIETTKVLFKEREVKLESTVGQQTKWIDFWQTKAEQNKKKPSLTDKLFGSIPHLETKLEKKNVECRSLADQVNKYKAELAASKSESSSASEVLTNREMNKGAAMTEQARCQSATPLLSSRINQSRGTQVSENLFYFTFYPFFFIAKSLFYNVTFYYCFFRVRRHSTVVTPVKECTTTFVIG